MRRRRKNRRREGYEKLYIPRSIGVGALDPLVVWGVKRSVNHSWLNSRFIERVNKRTNSLVQGEYKSLGIRHFNRLHSGVRSEAFDIGVA